MNYLGIDYNIKNVPILDQEFVPFGVWAEEYLKEAKIPISIAVERENGLVSVRKTHIRGGEFKEADLRFVERLIKFELWSIGGFKVYVCGCDDITEQIAKMYAPGGERYFDYEFFLDVYEKPLKVVAVSEEDFPASNESARQIGGHMDGCRIGFDAGGSDRKVSAVIDGNAVYSEEVVWYPKIT
ncbi:MAG: ROK family protein, partial [Eggerthellaceae bacterium]|nr:ROK family protein [Eggerthellaceae bacterium]